MTTTDLVRNIPAPNVPYFTPAQIPPAGTALVPQPSGKPVPTLFQPIKIRGVEFPNRIWVRRRHLHRKFVQELTLHAAVALVPIFSAERSCDSMAYGTQYDESCASTLFAL